MTHHCPVKKHRGQRPLTVQFVHIPNFIPRCSSATFATEIIFLSRASQTSSEEIGISTLTPKQYSQKSLSVYRQVLELRPSPCTTDCSCGAVGARAPPGCCDQAPVLTSRCAVQQCPRRQQARQKYRLSQEKLYRSSVSLVSWGMTSTHSNAPIRHAQAAPGSLANFDQCLKM